MQNTTKTTTLATFRALLLVLALLGTRLFGGDVLDDFSHPENNSLGFARIFLSDTVAGGSTSTERSFSGGVLSVKGEIVPPRGQPGWASTVLLLDPQGQASDLSQYQGIKIRLRVTRGNLSISANSSKVTNFDYHAATIARHSDGQFHEVTIPFDTMKRAWSEQTKLNTKTIASVSLVAFAMQKEAFEYEVDEIGFY